MVRAGWLGVDVLCVLLFCALGRRSHDEGLSAAGVVTTAWPFLSGTVVGWLVSAGWRRPAALVPTGWPCGCARWGRDAVAQGHRIECGPRFRGGRGSLTAALLLGWRAAVAATLRGRRGASKGRDGAN
ncbi:hypothetical protein I553_1866 [Mycobacterium xenopi 4042]|uniref:DUF3054 domain-containing protein n=1 Tax=Mycobacterium xenopi 4042 TaxID=1299334 RepID=X8DLU6_MYCXE|nr:hypothetical protein I553_1866 [Mycobacterium xenopi 4042]